MQYSNEQLNITVMEKSIKKRRNYRITIILKDEIIDETFETQNVAINTVKDMRDLFPDIFVGGAVEEKRKKWKIIWTTSSITKKN